MNLDISRRRFVQLLAALSAAGSRARQPKPKLPSPSPNATINRKTW